MSDPTILLTGATGFLGAHLGPALAACGTCVPLGHRAAPAGGRQVDLTDAAATTALLEEIGPDAIVHAAALADVDACERDPAAAYRVNVAATRHLTQWVAAKRPGATFLYISTDQVYDARGESREEEVRPVNVYALTKLWSEDLVRQLAGGAALRVNFFGQGSGGRRNFVDWIVESLSERRQITGFRDVVFNPLHVDQLSALVVEMLQRRARGTFNLGASGGGLTKADFIAQVAEVFGLSTATCRIGSLDDVDLAARRPRDMTMSVARAETFLGRSLPTVADGIAALALQRRRRAS